MPRGANLTGLAKGLTPTQKAALSEAAVCNHLLIQTEGRVHCARPQPDDHGVDFKVYQPGVEPTLDLQIKAAFSTDPKGHRRFVIRLEDIPSDARRYFVLCVEGTTRFPGLGEWGWLIPGTHFGSIGRRSGGFPIAAAPPGGRPSQWDRFALRIQDLGAAVLERISEAVGGALPQPQWKGLSPQAKGKVMEDAVAFEVMVGSEGRLAVFQPKADTVGLDLDVMGIDGRTSVPAQVKGAFVDDVKTRVTVEVSQRTFRPRRDRYVVIGAFHAAKMELGPAVWAVPSQEFGARASRVGKNLVFLGSPKPNSKDEWAAFRYSPEELHRVFEAAIEVRAVDGPRAPLPATRAEVARVAATIRPIR